MARLFIDADLATGARVALDEAQTRYLTDVLRQRAGAHVLVFNGRDGEHEATLAEIGKRSAALDIGAQTRAQALPPDLLLLFSPLKRQATDWLVEKATELGVLTLQPVMMRRTVADTVRVDRLVSIAREAAEQTERLDVPEVREAVSLARIVDGWDASRPLIYCDEQGEAPPILQALDALLPREGKLSAQLTEGAESQRLTNERSAAAPSVSPLRGDPPSPRGEGVGVERKLALLIGPEGGFEADERRMLRALPFVVPVSLGPRILRAETAAAASLALIQAAWGDWR